MRKICVVITARPSYSRIRTALAAIKAHPNLELQLVVGASALLERYGNTVDIIEKDGYRIDACAHTLLEGENKVAMAKSTGLAVLELSSLFSNMQPDAVVTIADRFETLATSIAAAYQNIPLVHVQGGEVSGNIDEKVRHANTKLADLHLVATTASRERVIKMGEQPDCVYVTGCPSIDLAKKALQAPQIDFDLYERYGGVGSKPDYTSGFIMVMQHPVTNEYHLSRRHIEQTLGAIANIDMPVFWFWPNPDAGGDGASTGIRSFRENHPLHHVHFFKSMEPIHFLKLLMHSKCLVGNSSAAIREGSFLGVRAINIGSRQNGRERSTNVLDVDYDERAILQAIRQALQMEKPARSELYGNGNAGLKIAEILAEAPLHHHKTITY